MITTLLSKETTTLIDGPAGKLELAIGEPTSVSRDAWGMVCHPHPLYGGTMHNKVVTTLIKAFQHFGLMTIRFNFRGVMRSEGKFDEGQGELEDLLAVVDWAQHQKIKKEIWLAGFSFGAYIAAKAATQIPISRVVTVAPPVEHFPMKTLPAIFCPWILVQGELDEVVTPQEVFQWAESRDPAPTIIRLPQAGHFFHGQLTALRSQIEKALAIQLRD